MTKSKVILCIIGFLVSFLTTPLGHRALQKEEYRDAGRGQRGHRKRHQAPIPRLGGLPILMALAVGLTVIFCIRPESSCEWTPILLGSVLMFCLGLWDDLHSLPARWKFIAQILIASLWSTGWGSASTGFRMLATARGSRG